MYVLMYVNVCVCACVFVPLCSDIYVISHQAAEIQAIKINIDLSLTLENVSVLYPIHGLDSLVILETF